MSQITVIDEVRGAFTKMSPEFKKALPAHVSVEKFQRVLMTSIQANPSVLQCDRTSLFMAATRSAQMGLLPDGREGAIVPFKGQAQFMPMIGGILKLIHNTGKIATIEAQLVYENDRDKFVYRPGIDSVPVHKPDWFSDRGQLVGAYAVAVTKTGESYVEIMNKKQIDQVRAVSRSATGPWTTWYDEMAKKTVIRRLSKRLPMDTDVLELIRDDDDIVNFSTQENVIEDSATKVKKNSVRILDDIVEKEHPSFGIGHDTPDSESVDIIENKEFLDEYEKEMTNEL